MGNSQSGNNPSLFVDFVDPSKPGHISNPPRRMDRNTSRSASNLRVSAASLSTDAPPPYSPSPTPTDRALPTEPPPVPPRDGRRASLREPSTSSLSVPQSSHRRALSHSSASRHPQVVVAPASGRSPGGGVGGFLSPRDIPSTRRTPSPVPTQPLHRSRSSTSVSSVSASSSAQTPQVQRVSSSSTAATHNAPSRRNSQEDPLELLRKFDTIIIVDDSSSMAGVLWVETRDALADIAEAAARYDTNGIDLYFLNNESVGTNLKSSQEVKAIFDRVEPDGITPIGSKLEELLLDYLLRFEEAVVKPKPINFVVLTDGAPTDDPEEVIMTAAKRLDAQHAPVSQVGIQFVQIGNDPYATEALRELDDELSNKHNIRDMVDTTLYSGQRLTAELLGKILLGGVNRRVDKKGWKAVAPGA